SLPELLAQADAARARRRFSDAEADYARILRADPAHREALMGLVQIELARQRAAEALIWSDTLVGSHPGDADALVLRGAALELGHDVVGARRAYRDALRIDPRHATARRKLRGR